MLIELAAAAGGFVVGWALRARLDRKLITAYRLLGQQESAARFGKEYRDEVSKGVSPAQAVQHWYERFMDDVSLDYRAMGIEDAAKKKTFWEILRWVWRPPPKFLLLSRSAPQGNRLGP